MSAEVQQREQWWAVIASHAKAIRSFIQRRVQPGLEVDDIAQAVHERLLRQKEPVSVEHPLAYIRGVVKHVIADLSQDALRQSRYVTTDSDAVARAAEELEDHTATGFENRFAELQQLERALRKLRKNEAWVLVLHDGHGFSPEEVAAQLALSAHTVAKYLVNARLQVRNELWRR